MGAGQCCLQNWWDHPEEARSEKRLMEEPIGREFFQKRVRRQRQQEGRLRQRRRADCTQPRGPDPAHKHQQKPWGRQVWNQDKRGVLITNQPDLGAQEAERASSPFLPRAAPAVLPEGMIPCEGPQGQQKGLAEQSLLLGGAAGPQGRAIATRS